MIMRSHAWNGIAAPHPSRQNVRMCGWRTLLAGMALAAVAAHRSHLCWDDFNDDDLYEPDPMHDLALDWGAPPAPPGDH